MGEEEGERGWIAEGKGTTALPKGRREKKGMWELHNDAGDKNI